MPDPHRDQAGAKLGMWLFLYSEMVLFGGLFLLYAAYLHRYQPEFHRAAQGLDALLGGINTVVLITSSLFMALSLRALQLGQPGRCLGMLALAVLLGASFLVNKGLEWGQKFQHGIHPGSPGVLALPQGEGIFHSLYFALTGLHALHVLVGVVLLCVVMVLVRRGRVGLDDPGHPGERRPVLAPGGPDLDIPVPALLPDNLSAPGEPPMSPGESQPAPHILTSRLLTAVWAALVCLTGLTVALASLDLGAYNILAALAIATGKALLVIAFFMHLKYESRLLKALLFLAFAVLAILIGLTFLDLAFRAPGQS